MTLSTSEARELKKFLQAPSRLNTPKHVFLSQRLEQAIETGLLPPGAKFPAEQELVSLAPYSLGTVQRAVQSLVESKLLVRKKRIGTFVPNDREEISQPLHFRFFDDSGTAFLPVYPKVLSRKRTSLQGIWSSWLPTENQSWIQLDRLVNVNDEFHAYSKFFVRSSQFPEFMDVPLKKLHNMNFRVFIEKNSHLRSVRIQHRVCINQTDLKIRNAIGLKNNPLCTILEILAADRNGDGLYYQELTVPPNKRKLFLSSDHG